MLEPRLHILMAERRLKITKVARDTGISRTTLTALYYGKGKGIQYETLNTLCSYLGVTPGEFFEYRKDEK